MYIYIYVCVYVCMYVCVRVLHAYTRAHLDHKIQAWVYESLGILEGFEAEHCKDTHKIQADVVQLGFAYRTVDWQFNVAMEMENNNFFELMG